MTKVTTPPVSAFMASAADADATGTASVVRAARTARRPGNALAISDALYPERRHNRSMICVPCRQRHHQDCPGGTWCDCQHLPARDARPDAAHPGPETALNWVRQGLQL